jgi:hypothetical protein
MYIQSLLLNSDGLYRSFTCLKQIISGDPVTITIIIIIIIIITITITTIIPD